MRKLLTKATWRAQRLARDLKQSLGEQALTVKSANRLMERKSLTDFLPYRHFDEKTKLIELAGDNAPALGFAVSLAPLMRGGSDTEQQLESLISDALPETILQFVQFTAPAITDRMDAFRFGRQKDCTDEMLSRLADWRHNHMLASGRGEYSLLPKAPLYPREMDFYLFVRIAFVGDPGDERNLEYNMSRAMEYRGNVLGTLESAALSPREVGEREFRLVLRRMLNMQEPPEFLDDEVNGPGGWPDLPWGLVDKRTRVRVRDDGRLSFSTDGERERRVSVLTTDSYPNPFFRLHMTGDIIGKLTSPTDRISAPYMLYTTIYKPDPDKARDQATFKLGSLSRQCMTDNEWYRGMVPHLFRRRDETKRLLDQTRNKVCIVRCYSGINIASTPERATTDADYAIALFRKAGYRISSERHITMPAFVASVPLAYRPSMDTPTQGLQRAQMINSLNAGSAAICQGDWGGNALDVAEDENGIRKLIAQGILLISRRGQLANINLFKSSTSYNFVVIATSGAGKSFITNEMVVDILSRGGMVRMVDVGGSYARLCNLLGGQELRFDPKKPMSLNPFWGIKQGARKNESGELLSGEDEGNPDGTDIGEELPSLKALVAQMAYPLGNCPDWQYQRIESVIWNVHKEKGERMEMRDVYDYLLESEDDRMRDLAAQLESFAVGRYSDWFNGPRELELSNRFTILEMEELNNDLELRNVVLMLTISAVTRDLYLSPRSIYKMFAVDEAWDLLRDARSGNLIETAFRRIRKYRGSAGIITQSFKDMDASAAAAAAYDNAPWKIILKQSTASMKYAREHGKLTDNEFILDMVSGVRPGAGYSEVYIEHEDGAGLFRFVVDPFSYFLYTTNPEDLAGFEELEEKGYSTIESIEILAQKMRDNLKAI